MSDLDLKKTGKWMNEALGETAAPQVLEERRAFLERVARKRRFPMGVYGIAAAALLVLSVGAYALLWNLSGSANPAYSPGPVEGHQVVAAVSGGEVIRFDGGSEFTVAQGSTARVINSSADEVVLGLSEGSVHCSVNSNGHTKWMVRAGGYQVQVTGTEFTVRFEPEALFVQVEVYRGTVLVTGEALNVRGIHLAAGEQISVDGSRVEITRSGKAKPPDTARKITRRSIQRTEKEPTKGNDSSVPQPDSTIQETVEPDLDTLILTLSYEDLWQLGKTARRDSRIVDARKILIGMRTRFPGKPYAKQATFLLGRLAIDAGMGPGDAIKWFGQYLQEAPGGALAEEALGRLINTCRTAGQSCDRKYATRYLAKYPDGPFAELAQSVLE